MITKIIYWMLNRLFLHHEAQMLESRNSSRRNAVQAAIDEYHLTRARDALNVAIEGAVGECKEHAAATAMVARRPADPFGSELEELMRKVERMIRNERRKLEDELMEVATAIGNAEIVANQEDSVVAPTPVGVRNGEVCNRNGCDGVIEFTLNSGGQVRCSKCHC